jgi:hypothetical protein
MSEKVQYKMTRWMSCAAILIVAAAPAWAQKTQVFATGLKNPAKIIAVAGGNFLVSESDTVANGGRVSLVDSKGARRTLLDGLPSGAAFPELGADGPTGMAVSGRTLYLAIGEGDSHRAAPAPPFLVPNPAGVSSPIFATILKVDFSNDIGLLNTGFSLKPADHNTLADHLSVKLTNTSGDQATVQLLAEFRPDRPDPVSIYRNTHLYALALLPSQPNALFVADAGGNAIWQVDLDTGRTHVLVRFPPTPVPFFLRPPVSEAVPDSIFANGNHLLVSLLSGVPFAHGASRIMDVDPATGAAAPFVTSLDSAIDVTRSALTGQYYVLEFSAALSVTPPQPGRLRSFDGSNLSTLVEPLVTPTSMVLDDAAGKLYITSLALGNIVTVDIR